MLDDIQTGFTDMLADIMGFVPRLVGALLLLFVGRMVARFLSNLAHKGLNMLKFDQVVDRSGLGAHIERAGFADSALLLAKIVGWMVMQRCASSLSRWIRSSDGDFLLICRGNGSSGK